MGLKMLKRVAIEDVQLGMFVHKLEGSWLSHPFWKSKFLLTDPDQLAELKDSAVPGILIDTDRGADVAARPAPSRIERPTTTPLSPAQFGRATRSPVIAQPRARADALGTQPFDPLSKLPRATQEEMPTAMALARRSTQAVRKIFQQARLGKAVKLIKLDTMIDEISSSVQRNPHAFTGIARMKKDNEYLYMHAIAVCALMINLARQLNLSPEEVRQAGLAGMLMDIGMSHIPQEIYDKDGPLTETEMAIVKTHTTVAYDLLAAGGDIPEAVLDVCLHHHERLDGSGYPHGLTGKQIGLFARMAAVCDAYDAMTSNRPQKVGADPSDALVRLGEDGRYDPVIFDALIRSIGIYPIGSLVRLRSNRLAIVIAQGQDDLTLPQVRVFYSVDLGKLVPVEEIDLSNCYGQDQIAMRELPSNWSFDNWDKMSAQLIDGSFRRG